MHELCLEGKGRGPDPPSGGKVGSQQLCHVGPTRWICLDSEDFDHPDGEEIPGEISVRGRSASRGRLESLYLISPVVEIPASQASPFREGARRLGRPVRP